MDNQLVLNMDSKDIDYHSDIFATNEVSSDPDSGISKEHLLQYILGKLFSRNFL